MRCRACNVELTDWESTRYDKESREYVDLCNSCFKSKQAAANSTGCEGDSYSLQYDQIDADLCQILGIGDY